jgi:hypothetical protein
VLWILSQRSLVIGTEEVQRSLSLGYRVATTSQELVLWPLQTIAAFPLRNEPAPMVVYVTYALLLLWIVLGATFLVQGPLRRAIWVAIALSFGIPWVITAVTLATFGTAWQGRYALPLLMGAAVVAGVVWARRKRAIGWRTLAPAVILVVVGQTAGPIAVLLNEVDHSPLAATDAWSSPHPAVLGVVLVLGAALLTLPVAHAVTLKGRAP